MSTAVAVPFAERTSAALADGELRVALGNIQTHLVEGRRRALSAVPQFDALRDEASRIKQHALDHLDIYLEQFAERVASQGGQVHWAGGGAEATALIEAICRRVGARSIVKGKSMVSEEIGLTRSLETAGFEVVETDLGEYIIQLRKDTPSHIVAPAVHLKREHYAAEFRRVHAGDPRRDLTEPEALLAEARAVLRQRFVTADVGITGANFLVAETGSAVLVTNEGNADLSMTLPRVHIVLATLEKVVPMLDDALTLVRVLARSATGQASSAYTTVVSAPRGAADADGPAEFHVILLDNGRTGLLGGREREMLKCIRCGACMNHCPVYGAIGGHAYGWVYPGPMGSVLTPTLDGRERHRDLPNASTFCGRCDSVCPVRIPLTRLMRGLRESQVDRGQVAPLTRGLLGAWAAVVRRPRLYRFVLRSVAVALRLWARGGRLRSVPLLGAWLEVRDLPVPAARSFRAQWRSRRGTGPA
jgi:L-lactate dehydrogenase complex protein LldF